MKSKKGNKRDIRTFEPDTDVAEMLDLAIESGESLGELVNAAVRKHGPGVLRERVEQLRRAASSLEKKIS
jgi:hypothetical protein